MWEYKVLWQEYPNDPADLNKLGKEGWELVSSIITSTDATYHYLKRRLERDHLFPWSQH